MPVMFITQPYERMHVVINHSEAAGFIFLRIGITHIDQLSRNFHWETLKTTSKNDATWGFN